jgi:wyosine [tRNA(Phe)-imidazoG37] synthetase (radical SAM superfamily)
MATFLFEDIVFGPVKSRRLGVSLGINLLPGNRKICNFNCIYCECGWTGESTDNPRKMPGRIEVREALEAKLHEMAERGEKPDVITYAGNGEPTLHPDFVEVINDSIVLRNRYFPDARIAVLSNATTISDIKIRESLGRIDMNILKLDSVFNDTVWIHNQPVGRYNVSEIIENLKKFNGKVIIQTLFLRGTYKGKPLDNTTNEEITGWLKALKEIKPSEVMIYTISRDTPLGDDLKKVSKKELDEIATKVRRLGIKTRVSG